MTVIPNTFMLSLGLIFVTPDTLIILIEQKIKVYTYTY